MTHSSPTIQPRDLFQLCVRVLGLVFFYQGLSSLPSFIEAGYAIATVDMIRQFTPTIKIIGLILNMVYPFALAWWLFRGAPSWRYDAPSLVDRHYPSEAKNGHVDHGECPPNE